MRGRVCSPVLLAIVAVGCGGGGGQSAGDFAKSLSEAVAKAQYGKAWAGLHPAYRAETTRAEWERCQREAAEERAGIKIIEIEVVETYADTYAAPKLGRVDATAVTLRLRFEHPLLEGEQEVTDTFHVLQVDGEWKGLWQQETYEAYRAGRCPD